MKKRNAVPRPATCLKPTEEGRERIIAALVDLKKQNKDYSSSRHRGGALNDRAIIENFGCWEAAFAAAFPVDSAKKPNVVINGKLHLYESKAPFVESGKSVRGALEYDISSDRMKCHECGEFFHSLGNHVHRAHAITAKEYKAKHGLKGSAALATDHARITLSDGARKRAGMRDAEQASTHMKHVSSFMSKSSHTKRSSRIKAGATERQNSSGKCRVQTLEKIKHIASAIGKTPSMTELLAYGVSVHDVRYHFGSVGNAAHLAGLLPNPAGGISKYTDDFLIQQMRIFFYNNRRLPRSTDFRRGYFSSSCQTYIARFGSWRLAIETIFSPKEIAKDKFWASGKHLTDAAAVANINATQEASA